ncbi:type IV pilus modification PilV family protein [Microbacterium telephonicum]|uniref:Pilin/secretion family protein with methylation motif n=1 Tax=Microbacterium telephonicum TaxID=1714841 RepID=A0A498CA12_9MICO|nr:prepilin-type N-terminal cleavage/methylation domain-containing protein [Microbacterium telephonicum]RLK49700.1 pilin/secretion family protein with methylation motif [Microbacterium telephonicum]
MRAHSKDDGFSLVEVIIAMFVLMVLALAVLPLMIGATRLSVDNKDLAAANAFASAQLAAIREDFPIGATATTSCAALQTRKIPLASAAEDPAGTGMAATVDVLDACPAAAADYPASIRVTVTVRDRSSDVLVTLPTRIRVSAS